MRFARAGHPTFVSSHCEFQVTKPPLSQKPAIDQRSFERSSDDRRPLDSAGPGVPTGPVDELSPDLLARLRNKDPAAMGRFYELYFDRVYGYVKRLLGEEHLAEDLTQDIFMHIQRSLHTYDPERALGPWVFTIATNKVRDFWRSRRHRDTLHESSLDDEDAGIQAIAAQPGPLPALENAELGRILGEAVEGLPESMRATLLLRYFEGLSFETIGQILGRNETAVRKRYSRALEELRIQLEKKLGTTGGGRA